MTDAPNDPAAQDLDAIAAALSRLRGRSRGRGEHPRHGAERGDHPEQFGHPGRPDHGGHGGLPHRPGHDRWPDGPGPAFGPAARMAGLARLRMLDALASASHPLSVSELGEAIGVDQPRASRLIQQGVELGLVRREADPDDARRTRVALTDEGAGLVRGVRGQRREQLTQALADFTDAERAELARLLTKLAAGWMPRA